MVERVLIVGAGPLAGKLLEEIERQPYLAAEVLGLVDDALSAATPLPYPVIGSLEDLPRLLEELRPDRVVVALASRRGRLPMDPLLQARVRGVIVEEGVDAFERLTGKLAIEALTPSALVFSRDFRKPRVVLALSRALSVTLALLGLVLLSPLFVLIALAILLDSRGPAFFAQDRVGAFGRRFKLVKFRTMHPTSRPPSEWERDNGYRVTRVGRVLRRFRLDELPQFFNVLRGDMNLVGPRPHPVSNYQLFVERIPYYTLRTAVRPGITGWAQVRYRYANDLAEETEKMRYDLFYVKHLSLWLDVRILLETAKAVLQGASEAPPPPAAAPAPAGGEPGEPR
ncbi:MAG TPA: exopolysaccharide biosynthesis polyprenyl glycosylphosphotransferase [Vicinamibacteria bacterium]